MVVRDFGDFDKGALMDLISGSRSGELLIPPFVEFHDYEGFRLRYFHFTEANLPFLYHSTNSLLIRRDVASAYCQDHVTHNALIYQASGKLKFWDR